MKLLVFDTETTGLPKTKFISPSTLHQWPTIVQFSYAVFDTTTHNFDNIQNHIIKVPDGIIIPDDSVEYHNITNNISENSGVPILNVLKEFITCLRYVDKLVGHNIEFDINMIKIELMRIIHHNLVSSKQLIDFKNDLYYLNEFKNIYCTLKENIEFCNIQAISKFGKSYLKYPKLVELHYKLFSTTPNNLHNSLNDILVTLRCFIKLNQNIDLLDNCKKFQELTEMIYSKKDDTIIIDA